MSEPAPVPQEILDRLARLEAQVGWLVQRAQAMEATSPGAAPAPRPAVPRPVPPPRIPLPAVQPSKPINPIVWIAGAGAALFLIGAAFFLHWSIQRGWLGPELRFLMGLAGGGALAVLAARLMLKENPRLGVALLLAGLGTLVFTFRWGAFEYRFFPPPLGFAATFVCVALAGGLGARVKSGAALTVALVTGLLAPLVFSQGGQHQVALAVYLAVLMGSALAVPYLAGIGARWHGARWVALTGTWILLSVAAFTVSSGDAGLLLALLVLHLLLAGLWVWLPGQAEPQPSAPTTLWFTVSVTFTGLAAYLWRQELDWTPEAFAVPVLGLAALNLALVKPLRVRLGGRQADLGLLALAAGHLALAVPIALAWRWVGPLWACFALALAWAAGYAEEHGAWDADEVKALRRLAFALACAATLRWMVHGVDVWDFGYLIHRGTTLTPFFNSRFAEGALAAAAWGLLMRGGGAWRVLGFLGLQGVGGLTLSLELAHLVRVTGGTVRTASIVLTLAWALLGALQWLRSLRGEEGALGLAAAGYTWLGLASFKLIVADLAHADTPTKALAFLGVGGIFLAAALVGNKVRGGRDGETE